MKNLLLAFCLFTFATTASAQFEIKSNPIALLFEIGVVSMEYSNLKDWGGQLDIYAAADGGVVFGSAKYYLIPKYGADRFHVGAFVSQPFNEDRLGIGFLLGYKLVSKKRIVFEVGIGAGRLIGESSSFDLTGYGNLNIGYRFLSKKNKDKVYTN